MDRVVRYMRSWLDTDPPHGVGALSAPLKGAVVMIRDVPLQEGDWAVAGVGDGAFLRVHPDLYGKMASNPAYSYFRRTK